MRIKIDVKVGHDRSDIFVSGNKVLMALIEVGITSQDILKTIET